MQNIELARKICGIFDQNEENVLVFVEDRKGHDIRYSLSGRKILKELSFHPKINFDSGIRNTVEWSLKNVDKLQNENS